MKNPVAKHMYKTSRSSVMVDRKKQSKIDPDTEAEMMLLDELRFEYRHPKNGEAYTVSLSREEVMEMMDQELFEKLTACFCECESIGETYVVDCRCDEYADQFELVIAPQPAEEIGEVVVTKDKLGNIVSVTRQDAEGRVLSVIAESDVISQSGVLAEGYFHPLPDESDYEFHDAEQFPDGSDCPDCIPALIVRKSELARMPVPDVTQLVEALDLALEYWRDRQQRYKNRRPKWVIAAESALAARRKQGGEA